MSDSAVVCNISDVKKINHATFFKKTKLKIKKILKNTKEGFAKIRQKCQKWTRFEMHSEIIFFYVVD